MKTARRAAAAPGLDGDILLKLTKQTLTDHWLTNSDSFTQGSKPEFFWESAHRIVFIGLNRAMALNVEV
jgi:hypothetical protein